MLIRPEVLAEHQFRLYGRARTRIRPPYALAALAVFGSVALLVQLACTTRYTERTQALGYLVPDAGIVRVRAPRPGIVEAVFVTQGQDVQRGDALVRIVSDRHQQPASTQSDARAENLGRRTEEIDRQEALGEQRLEIELARLASERRTLEDEARLVLAQVADQSRWVAVARDRLERLRRAAIGGAVARADLLRLENDVIAGEIQQKSLERTLLSVRGEIDRRALEAQNLDTELGARRSALALTRLELAATAIENDDARGELVVAPAAGRVVTLAAQARSGIETGRELAVIAPSGGGIRADLFVPASAIGLVKEGASVSIRYDAFPYSEYGVHAARVREIGQFVFDRREIDVELELRGPVFRVVATPEREEMATANGRVRLRAGMTLRADITLREMRVVDWLLEPVLGWRAAPFAT